MPSKSDHALNGPIIKIQRGIAIYKTHASPFWNARIRNSKTGKYIVRSTKEKSSIKARIAAVDLASDLLTKRSAVPDEFSFKHYATRFISKGQALADRGDRNDNYIRTSRIFLDNPEWGLMKEFSDHDVREIKTRQYQQFMDSVHNKRPDLSPSTRNGLTATLCGFRLKPARYSDGKPAIVPN